MSDTRPVNLDIATVRLPISAYASILHRICAVIIWVGFTALLVIASSALKSEASFDDLAVTLQSNFLVQFLVWGFLSALGYYCMGTIKHIIQDFGHFEDKKGGQMISTAAIAGGVVLCLLAGVLVWA
ncbi:succinate dehydrogenase, cytochrome b556 subunit [Halioxenophilus aromaticivorans]|uniref:Succinate dehydrogenase cytochrome b556 subunit n=1 Tax=Halioxenophilus aromaticivorans TaxID=1306992 RepID=A0AAV3U4V1_9ALTE